MFLEIGFLKGGEALPRVSGKPAGLPCLFGNLFREAL